MITKFRISGEVLTTFCFQEDAVQSPEENRIIFACTDGSVHLGSGVDHIILFEDKSTSNELVGASTFKIGDGSISLVTLSRFGNLSEYMIQNPKNPSVILSNQAKLNASEEMTKSSHCWLTYDSNIAFLCTGIGSKRVKIWDLKTQSSDLLLDEEKGND